MHFVINFNLKLLTDGLMIYYTDNVTLLWHIFVITTFTGYTLSCVLWPGYVPIRLSARLRKLSAKVL